MLCLVRLLGCRNCFRRKNCSFCWCIFSFKICVAKTVCTSISSKDTFLEEDEAFLKSYLKQDLIFYFAPPVRLISYKNLLSILIAHHFIIYALRVHLWSSRHWSLSCTYLVVPNLRAYFASSNAKALFIFRNYSPNYNGVVFFCHGLSI